ncbi:MAG: 50S ribosomal protein L35 [Candidatus Omnitrophica bacterium]|nr:50S ribosomal protein L35 [Candidatus Omnitrophota bacterium]
MPTLKTVKGVKRRVKVTGTGKLLAYGAGRRHLLLNRSRKAKRQMRRPRRLAAPDERMLKALIPYA